MTEHPIPFSGPMIQPILDKRKTQTRRIIRLTKDGRDFRSPYGVPGDHLWVRETWACSQDYDDVPVKGILAASDTIWWKAALPTFPEGMAACHGKWRPPMFMPRFASRIILVNEGEHIERVQEITPEDAIAEGIRLNDHGQLLPAYPSASGYVDPRKAFRSLWDSINGKRKGCSWADNPRVRVVTFRLLEVKA